MPGYPGANVIYTERLANKSAATQSAQFDVSNAKKMFVKAELSTNSNTAVVAFLFKDINGVTMYTIQKTIANSAKQLGVTNAGWYQGEAFSVDVDGVYSIVIDLVSISAGAIYLYTGEGRDA